MALMSGCKCQQPTVSVPKNDSVAMHHDYGHSITLVRDSVFIHMKGDTVWQERWHTEYRDSIRLVSDTLYKDKEVIVQLPPERYIPPWAWWSLGICIVIAVLIVARIILRIYLER